MAFTSSAKASSLPRDPDDFEDHVKHVLEKDYGYEVVKPPRNQQGYDLEIKRDGKSIAVQVKNYKRPVNIAQIQKFSKFMELEISNRQFGEAWLISSRGFSNFAIANLNSQLKDDRERPKRWISNFGVPNETKSRVNLSLGTVYQDCIKWDYQDPKSSLRNRNKYSSPSVGDQSEILEEESRRYFGIFTGKGGTGKTTVAAHLAGAFAKSGYDVVLVDIDPERNLTKLFQNDLDNNENEDDNDVSLFVDSDDGNKTGNIITAISYKRWQDCEDDYRDEKIVICDCSPNFQSNPTDLVKKFNYCVIPTSLNPLGIAKNSDVIMRTFDNIRSKNNEAEMFVLINNYHEDRKSSTLRTNNNLLFNLLKEKVKSYFVKDRKCHLISPYGSNDKNCCAIRYSQSLFYWGLHIVKKGRPELAFKRYGGKSNPLEDFLRLAEYLENHDRVSLTKT